MQGRAHDLVDGTTIVAGTGAFAFGPRDVPHALIVSSGRGRFLRVTTPAGMEGFIRALGEPAPALEVLPAPTGPPEMGPILTAAAAHGIELLGPPGGPA